MKWLRLLALISLCVLLACSRHSVKDLPAQTYQGFEVKLLSVENKGSEWTDSDTQRYQAPEGQEVVVAEVNFKALTPGGHDLVIQQPELEDTSGNRFPSLVSNVRLIRQAHLDKAVPFPFPFDVPKGAELKTLRMDSLAFDLR